MTVGTTTRFRAAVSACLAIALLAPLTGTAQGAIIGPDSFGYTADDDAPGSFEDITPDATARGVLPTSTEPIGFDFPFYGTTYTEVNVWEDGILTFGDVEISLPEVHTDLNVEPPPTPTIAPMWRSWDSCHRPPQIFAETLGSGADQRFIVQWNDLVADFNTCEGDGFTFEAVLFANGVIEFRYLDFPFDVDATVGITNGADNGAPGNGQVLQVSLPSQPLSVTGTPGASPRAVLLPAAKIIHIVALTHTLTVDVVGPGSVAGPGIVCPGDCVEILLHNAVVQLRSDSPLPVIWGGDCAATRLGETCDLTMDGDHHVTALFGGGGDPDEDVRLTRPRVYIDLLGRTELDRYDIYGEVRSRRPRCKDGVAVELLRSGGRHLATTHTNEQGWFAFDFELGNPGNAIKVIAHTDATRRCRAADSDVVEIPAVHIP